MEIKTNQLHSMNMLHLYLKREDFNRNRSDAAV